MAILTGIDKVLPMDKLLDVLSKGVGRVTKFYFDRQDIKTKALEIEKIAEARAKEIEVLANALKENGQSIKATNYSGEGFLIKAIKEQGSSQLMDNNLFDRAAERLDFVNAKKQLNLESVAAFAAEQISKEETVSSDPLDEDWIRRFFSIAEDISNEEMQALWGRILAGEVKRPKSYSLRTLEILKNITKDEAKIFEKFAQIALISNNLAYICISSGITLFEKEFAISHEDIMLASELGLISETTNASIVWELCSEETIEYIKYGKKGFLLKRAIDAPSHKLPCLILTTVGRELVDLVEPKPNKKYLEMVCEKLKHKGGEIFYGDLIIDSNGKYSLENQVRVK